jgi:hypothetical protein
LPFEMGDDWNQKKISLLQGKELIDEELISEVPNALSVTPEAIKNFEDESTFNILSNTYHDQCASLNCYCTLLFFFRALFWFRSYTKNL